MTEKELSRKQRFDRRQSLQAKAYDRIDEVFESVGTSGDTLETMQEIIKGWQSIDEIRQETNKELEKYKIYKKKTKK